MLQHVRWLYVGAVSLTLGACGITTPDMENPWEDKQKSLVKIDELTTHTTCEIVTAFRRVFTNNRKIIELSKRKNIPNVGLSEKEVSEIANWRAQVILTLTVDEKTQFNPGIAFNAVYSNSIKRFINGNVTVGQSGALALAGQYTPSATRKITVGFSFYLRDFLAGPVAKQLAELSATENGAECSVPGGTFIDGDLKFDDTLRSALLPAFGNEGDPYTSAFLEALKGYSKSAKKDVIQHEVTFTLVYGANSTPSVKLVDFSANQASNPFLGVQRTNTQNVLITVGPDGSSVAGATILSSQIVNGFAAALARNQN